MCALYSFSGPGRGVRFGGGAGGGLGGGGGGCGGGGRIKLVKLCPAGVCG